MAGAKKIRDFRCTYANSVGVSPEVTQGLDLEFPDAYCHRDTMATLSLAIKEHDGANFCLLPFCRTVEVEAMGGNVKLGDAKSCPRAADPVCESYEDFMALPDIDFSQGRIREVLEACRILKQRGETVCLEIVGPWTMMQSLMDAAKVFKMFRKQPDQAVEVMWKLAGQLLPYVDEARECGVDVITLSDSAGTLSILGPRVMEKSMLLFMADFVRALDERIGGSMVLQLCPKIAYALIDTGCAEVKIHDLGESVDFLEALLRLRGEARIVGQTCIKYVGVRVLNGKIRELVMKEPQV